MEITRLDTGAWVPKQAKDLCYSCHPSGPRALRPLTEPGADSHQLEVFNRRILSYGVCDFGDAVNVRTRGKPSTDSRCTGCHDGVARGKLYGIHLPAIQFKTERDATMPPESDEVAGG